MHKKQTTKQIHTISPSIYYNELTFKTELKKIFYKLWIWVAHESEINKPGDFRTTFIGKQPIIIIRDKNNRIKVLQNRCRHRGSILCEQQKGNTTKFYCPYHGWSYNIDGSLNTVPYSTGYTGILNTKRLSLIKLRYESYNGLIFASFNKNIEPLKDFLGNAKIWIDLFMKQGAGYNIKTNGEHKFKFKGNWKIQLENTTDLYHFPIVHKSWLRSIDSETKKLILSFINNEKAFCRSLSNGHSLAILIPELIDLDIDEGKPLPKRFEKITKKLSKKLPIKQVRYIIRSLLGVGFNLNLFPNIALSMSFFRVLNPISVEETEIRHIALGMQDGPEIANKERLRIHEHFQGPFGFGSSDDIEVWEKVQRGIKTGNNWPILINRGINREIQQKNGTKTSNSTDETGIRANYEYWKKIMKK